MQIDSYSNISTSADYKSFVFISEGRHGQLFKLVRFDELKERANTFNLALGTVSSNGVVDYLGTSNNGDRNKILATVAQITFLFLERYPDKCVYLTGSDQRRTLLYHRAISYGYSELVQLFNIYGYNTRNFYDENFEPFSQRGNYTGFLIEKR